MHRNVELYLYGSRPVVDTSGQERMRSSEVCVSVRASGDTPPPAPTLFLSKLTFTVELI